MLVLILFEFLILKHFLVDFPLQPSYMYLNKGNLKHLGGYLHAGLHSVFSYCFILLAFKFNRIDFNYLLVFYLCSFEFVIHYFTDYAKLNINKVMNWKPNTHEEFWYLLGVDQLIHYQTYVFMIYYLIIP